MCSGALLLPSDLYYEYVIYQRKVDYPLPNFESPLTIPRRGDEIVDLKLALRAARFARYKTLVTIHRR